MAEGDEDLLRAATRQLDRGDFAEAERTAKRAAEAAGDGAGRADALRLVVLCRCQAGRREAAAELAEEEWARCQQEGDRPGAARMLLALSEANCLQRGRKKRLEAFKSATDALRGFRELGEKRMQAAVFLVMVNLYLQGLGHGSRQKNLQDAVELAREAHSIYQMAGDTRLQAEALHALAYARMQTGALEAGLRHAKEALQLFHELGMARSELCESQCIAEALLRAGMPKQAQPFAEEAVAMARRMDCSSDWEAAAVGTLVHTLLAKSDGEKALQVAKEAVLRFQEAEDKVGELLAQDLLSSSHSLLGDAKEALFVTEQALKLAGDLGRRKQEVALLRRLAQLHLELKDHDAALAAAEKGLKASRQLQGSADRAACLGTTAQVRRARKEPQAALQTATEERELSRKGDDPRGEAIAALLSASLLSETDDGQRATAVAAEARSLFREAGDARGQAAALQLAAHVHSADGRQDLAQKLAREALPLLRELGDARGEASMLLLNVQASLLGLLSSELDPATFRFADGADKATTGAKEAVTVSRRAGDGSLLGTALCVLAQAQLLAARSQEVVQAASAAVAVLRGAGDQHGEAYALLLNANGLLCSSKQEKAREAAGRALSLFQELEDDRGKAMAQHAVDVIDNPPELDEQLFEGYGDVVQEASRSAAAALAGAKASLAVAALKETVRSTVNDIVGLDELQDDTPLMQMGLTSQSAVLLRNALTKELPGPSLPFTMMFDYPSITHLTEFFVSRGVK